MNYKKLIAFAGLMLGATGMVACVIYEQEVNLNLCDLRSPPPDTECFDAYWDTPVPPRAVSFFVITNRRCVLDPATGAAASSYNYVVRPRVVPGSITTPNVHVSGSPTFVCAGKDSSGTLRPTLVNVTAAGAAGTVAQLDAYQGHDDSKVVRASVSARFPDYEGELHLITDPPPSYPAGALEWVLQMYDFGTSRWVDLRSIRSRPIESSWASTVVEGQLTAEVPGNTSVRLELRSNGAGRRVRILDARLFAPICVRDQVSGKCQ